MDLSVQPQKDFYLFSNGQWIKNNPIPDDYARWSIFDVLERKNIQELISLIQSIPKDKFLSSKRVNQQIFEYFESGMNIQMIEKFKSKPLAPLISEIQKYHEMSKLYPLIAKLHAIEVNVFFQIGR